MRISWKGGTWGQNYFEYKVKNTSKGKTYFEFMFLVPLLKFSHGVSVEVLYIRCIVGEVVRKETHFSAVGP